MNLILKEVINDINSLMIKRKIKERRKLNVESSYFSWQINWKS